MSAKGGYRQHEAKIARLRAEMERLKVYQCADRCTHVCHRYPLGTIYAIEELERERDEALARIEVLEATLNDIPCAGPSSCEILAQVAALRRGYDGTDAKRGGVGESV